MNHPKTQRLQGVSQPQFDYRAHDLFSKLPTAITVLCLTFLSFMDCAQLNSVSTSFLKMTTTAQSLMETTSQSSNPGTLKPISRQMTQFLNAVFKKCSARLSSLIFPFATQKHYVPSRKELQLLKELMEKFPNILTIQIGNSFLYMYQDFCNFHDQDFKLFHKIEALSITRASLTPWNSVSLDLSSVCPKITTLAITLTDQNGWMELLVKIETLTALTLQSEHFDDYDPEGSLEGAFRDIETTPFKNLKRLSLGKHSCCGLLHGWGSICKFAPQLEELHISPISILSCSWLICVLKMASLKIFSIHFHNYETDKEAQELVRRLSDPQVSCQLERLDIVNVPNEAVEAISTARPDLIVNQDCCCNFLGAICGSCPRFWGCNCLEKKSPETGHNIENAYWRDVLKRSKEKRRNRDVICVTDELQIAAANRWNRRNVVDLSDGLQRSTPNRGNRRDLIDLTE